ncbi:MAG: ATP synthase F1 subunit delta [Candidatus Obscuribacterales bacterium]|nr:ATP synthase F1 subunit delta [Candidatus Obscuribacterales bacterium]
MKTEEKTIAVQYANALLQLADASGDLRNIYGNLDAVAKAFKGNPELLVLFKHPAISAPQRLQLLKEMGKDLDKLSARMLELLVERRKIELLPTILEEFYELLRARHNRVTAQLVCAEQISEQESESIKQKLEKKLNKTVELSLHIDKSLIGGYVLKIGDQVIDGSLKGRLQSIEKSLLSV